MDKKLLASVNKSQDIAFKVKSVDNENHIVEGIFSTEIEDRHGEIVVQRGWLLDNYMKNPVVLWAHDSTEPPIGKMTEIGVNPATNQLEGKIQFAVKEYPFAKTIFDLITGGYQKAFSAGFINNKYEIDKENDKVYLIENELLEVSAVPVPANQLALAKAKGVDITAYEKEMGIEKEEEQKSPACRMDNETKNECVSRKIAEIMKEDPSMSQEQAIAIAENVCDTACSEKAIEMISQSNMETISRAIGTLAEVLKARNSDKAKAQEVKKVEHPTKNVGDKNKVSVKILNKAIRELLGVKKTL